MYIRSTALALAILMAASCGALNRDPNQPASHRAESAQPRASAKDVASSAQELEDLRSVSVEKVASSAEELEALLSVLEFKPDNQGAPADIAKSTGSGTPGWSSIESVIIQGVANFVIKRARQEAISFVLEELDKQVCGGELVKTLLGRTCALFKAADAASTSIAPGRMFRLAVTEDLRALPYSLAMLAHEQSGKAKDDKRIQWKRIAAGFFIVHQLSVGLEQHVSPLAVVLGMAENKTLIEFLGITGSSIPTELKLVLRLLVAQVQEARNEDLQKWIRDPSALGDYIAQRIRAQAALQLKRLLKDGKSKLDEITLEPAQRAARPELAVLADVVDMVYERIDAFLADGASDAALQRLIGDFDQLTSSVKGTGDLAEAARAIATTASVLSKLIRKPDDVQGALNIIQKHLGLARDKINSALADETNNSIKELLGILQTDLNEKWDASELDFAFSQAAFVYKKHLATLAPRVIDVYAAVQRLRDTGGDADQQRAALSQLIGVTLALVKDVVVSKICKSEAGAKQPCAHDYVVQVLDAARYLIQGDYDMGLMQIMVLAQEIDGIKELPGYTQIARYAPLLTAVATAESGDEVVAAIESSAAPAGSWRLRRKKATLGLSGRLGFGGGYERLQSSNAATFGLSLPIIIDFWGNDVVGSWPAGIGVQLVDLGSVASVSEVLGEDADEVEPEPELGFAQVLAPGLGVALGLGDTPFLLTASASWSPALRQDTDTDDTRSALRVLLNFSVDVPIFIW